MNLNCRRRNKPILKNAMEVLNKIGLTLLATLCIYLTLVLSDPIHTKAKCEKCSPGYIDSNNCLETGRPTNCSSCKNGKYSSKLDYSTQCTDCSTLFGCNPSLTLLRNCTAEHDSRCGCKKHEYMDTNGICRINRKEFNLNNGTWCRKCQAGFCKEKDCTEDGTNSSCLPCDVSPNPTIVTNMTTAVTKVNNDSQSNTTRNQPESSGGNTTVVIATVAVMSVILFIAIIIGIIWYIIKIKPKRQSYDLIRLTEYYPPMDTNIHDVWYITLDTVQR